MRIAVIIATFQRPEGLAKLLRSIESTTAHDAVEVFVVDNDPHGSARATVEDTALRCHYAQEPIPGIAAARNRGLDMVGDEFDTLVIVDDDEVVLDGWLEALTAAAAAFSADVVCGAVLPRLPPDCPKWIARGGFFDRPRATTGSDVRWPATNNVLVRREVLTRLEDPHFSEEYSITGGSDTELFARIRDAGGRFCWSDEAIVIEDIPSSRTNARWLWRRGVRLGNVSARMLARRGRPRGLIFVMGTARVLVAPWLTLLASFRPSVKVAPAAMHLPKGIGMMGAAVGTLVKEYGR